MCNNKEIRELVADFLEKLHKSENHYDLIAHSAEEALELHKGIGVYDLINNHVTMQKALVEGILQRLQERVNIIKIKSEINSDVIGELISLHVKAIVDIGANGNFNVKSYYQYSSFNTKFYIQLFTNSGFKNAELVKVEKYCENIHKCLKSKILIDDDVIELPNEPYTKIESHLDVLMRKVKQKTQYTNLMYPKKDSVLDTMIQVESCFSKLYKK
jgi:hypothetical protein